jgi:hypothetical protein
MQAERWTGLFPCFIFIVGCALVAGLIAWVLLRASTPTLSQAEVSGTREAVQFATSQADRRATMKAGRATGTAIAWETATAEAHGRGVAASQTSIAAATAARATAEAPPTLTAQAQAHETAQVQAEATAQVLDRQATVLYGPISGTLEQIEGVALPCTAAGVSLRDFVAEATFRNPEDAGFAAGGAWDYGLIFSNIGEATEYRVILDSESAWTFNLHSSGYDISIRDTTSLLDLSGRGSNTLKLYVTGDTAQLYVNGHYIDTFELVMLGLGQASQATHDVMVCAGIREEYAAVGRLTRYEGFRAWSLP